jgi:hypothetical protein
MGVILVRFKRNDILIYFKVAIIQDIGIAIGNNNAVLRQKKIDKKVELSFGITFVNLY